MADYRVNGNGGRGYAITQNGSAGNEFQGVYGLQKAFDTATSGDNILLYSPSATPMLMNVMVTMSIQDRTSTWIVGDSVRNNTGSGNHWTGILCEITTNSIVVELITGTYSNVTPSEGVENTTRSETSTMSAVTCPGLTIDVNSGTNAGYITLRGVASDYSTKTLAVLDGNDICQNIISANGRGFWKIEYIRVRQAVVSGLRGVTTQMSSWILDHVISDNNGQYGFDLSNHSYVHMSNFIASYNGYAGISCIQGKFFHGKIMYNSREGFYAANVVVLMNCIIAKNGRSNVRIFSGDNPTIIGNVIHGAGSGYNGILLDSGIDVSLILYNRITNNNLYGISTNTTNLTNIEDYNYFQGNGSGERQNVATGLNSVTGTDTNYGYTDVTNDDYTLASNASMVNVAVNLDWQAVS